MMASFILHTTWAAADAIFHCLLTSTFMTQTIKCAFKEQKQEMNERWAGLCNMISHKQNCTLH
jgi:hypothetical protein